MARFLFSVLPTRGHMYPALPIALALRAAGHEVGFVTLPEFRHLLEPHGIACLPLHRGPNGQAAQARRTRRAEGAGRDAAKAAFVAAFLAPLAEDVPALRDACAAWRPDVLVNDYVSYAPLLAGELLTIPVATLNMTVATWPGENLAPFGLGLPPARDEATRTRYAALRAGSEAFYADVLGEYNAIRAGFDLAPRDGPLARATLSAYLQMIQTVPELDYGRDDLPPWVHYIGPCAWDPPAQLDSGTDTWLAALPTGVPLALVAASGAFTRSAALVETALAMPPTTTTGDLPGPAVLATLPFDHPLHDAMAALPANVRLARFAPHLLVLPRASVVVTHGGFGTVTKALSHGLPLVVVPYAGDQPEVAERVTAAGAGLRLTPATLTPDTLRDAIATVIGDDRYRRAALQVAAALGAQDGPATARALLERLAATAQPVLAPAPAVWEPETERHESRLPIAAGQPTRPIAAGQSRAPLAVGKGIR